MIEASAIDVIKALFCPELTREEAISLAAVSTDDEEERAIESRA